MGKWLRLIVFGIAAIFVLLLGACRGSGSNNDMDKSVNQTQNASTGEDDIKIETFAGGIITPNGIVFDGAGNMYATSRSTTSILKFKTDGSYETFVELPSRIAYCMITDKENNIYVTGGDKFMKVTPDGKISVLLDGFTCCDDLVMDDKGNIYMTDAFENRVYKITKDLKKSVFIENDIENLKSNTYYKVGIGFSPDYKNLYVTNMEEGKVIVYPIDEKGNPGDGKVLCKLPRPDHMTIDRSGNIYITLFRDGKLARIDAKGNVDYIPQDYTFSNPTGLAFGNMSLVKTAYLYPTLMEKE
jgi:sugar lactone lactonase YvrE